MDDKIKELINGVQQLYQITRSAGVNADAHDLARSVAEKLIKHLNPNDEVVEGNELKEEAE